MGKTRTARRLVVPFLALALILPLLLLGTGHLPSAFAYDRTVTAIVQFSGEPLAQVLPDHVRLAALARARAAMATASKADPEAMSVEELMAPQLARLEAEKSDFERGLVQVAPDAAIHARFDTLLDGEAITLPASELPLLHQLPGVASVNLTEKYRPTLFDSVPLIDAPAVWAQLGGVARAGLGEKIAIVDTGIDQTHPFLTDNSLTPPPGFPLGDPSFTSNKVIVAKSYPPAGDSFTPQDLFGHGTHVSGIAAGVSGVVDGLSGVAPKAFLMNYNVFGNLSDADTADIARAVEDAVNDGADVVNLSLGGPSEGLETDPLVVAIRNGINAGVVFAIAAGNDGPGDDTILSPGITPEAITVGASTKSDTIASFSSRGPDFNLAIKPDLMAPGVGIYSSRPGGSYAFMSGTSMATPHVAGAAALLLQLHPTWTPAQVKSALMDTATFTTTTALSSGLAEDRGDGRIDLAAAANAGLTVDPPSYSFDVIGRGSSGFGERHSFAVTAQPGGDGAWSIAVTQTVTAPGITVTVSNPSLNVGPGASATFDLDVAIAPGATVGDYEGYVTLTNGVQSLHVPYWFRLVAFRLLLIPAFKNAEW